MGKTKKRKSMRGRRFNPVSHGHLNYWGFKLVDLGSVLSPLDTLPSGMNSDIHSQPWVGVDRPLRWGNSSRPGVPFRSSFRRRNVRSSSRCSSRRGGSLDSGPQRYPISASRRFNFPNPIPLEDAEFPPLLNGKKLLNKEKHNKPLFNFDEPMPLEKPGIEINKSKSLDKKKKIQKKIEIKYDMPKPSVSTEKKSKAKPNKPQPTKLPKPSVPHKRPLLTEDNDAMPSTSNLAQMKRMPLKGSDCIGQNLTYKMSTDKDITPSTSDLAQMKSTPLKGSDCKGHISHNSQEEQLPTYRISDAVKALVLILMLYGAIALILLQNFR